MAVVADVSGIPREAADSGLRMSKRSPALTFYSNRWRSEAKIQVGKEGNVLADQIFSPSGSYSINESHLSRFRPNPLKKLWKAMCVSK
jgi:hypothetical protein